MPRERAAEPARLEGPLPSGPLVLVVEDYRDAREACCEYLGFFGFRVAEARNGLEALERAQTLRPACVLMDITLPGSLDGWEATRRLKADPRTRGIPVIALSGHSVAVLSRQARETGCDAFLRKPCAPDDMVAEVQRLVALAEGDGRGAQ